MPVRATDFSRSPCFRQRVGGKDQRTQGSLTCDSRWIEFLYAIRFVGRRNNIAHSSVVAAARSKLEIRSERICDLFLYEFA
ncbi:hypothetical protein A5630_15470 [Mycolicibacterium mucogenicum]|uniref:Uncharacterized protein n=1 Tax=Mycolicibacterium mucogenicum TaxID=56689 RepID=A0A1A3HB49_MYCMU|nr:hypothetical protein A5630_15470 [Mycolicibacterium mucogenicum]